MKKKLEIPFDYENGSLNSSFGTLVLFGTRRTPVESVRFKKKKRISYSRK